MIRRRSAIGATIAAAIAAVVAAFIVWEANSGLDLHGPAALVKVAGWLGEEGECFDGVELESSRIPVGPHGPPGTFFQTFGELPEAGALASCRETVDGFIGWFRFASAKDMLGALRRHPEITEHEMTCIDGRELLIDSLLSYDKFVSEDCRNLGFRVHRATR
jgi:hypothetical protein